jgi:hypothetical protein
MSDNWLRYLPVDPQFQPSLLAAKAAEALLASLLPEAEEISSEFTESVAFIDPGANWSGVQCPCCGVDAQAWWDAAMSAAAQTGFISLSVRASCCQTMTSLNAMHYVWPAAFGRYVIEAMNPNVKSLSTIQLDLLAAALGCPVIEVAVHI